MVDVEVLVPERVDRVGIWISRSIIEVACNGCPRRKCCVLRLRILLGCPAVKLIAAARGGEFRKRRERELLVERDPRDCDVAGSSILSYLSARAA